MIFIKTWLKVLLVFSKRLIRFIFDFLLIVLFIFINLIKNNKIYDNNIVFVTAAEKNYFEPLKNLLISYQKNLKNKIIVYDLGLEEYQKSYIIEKFKFVDLRKFDFNQYPDFVGQYFDNKLGNYSWKPIIVEMILKETKCKVVWLDSGNVINNRIIFLKIALTRLSIIVPVSSNKISDWTHEKTREYIEIDEKLLNLNNYASGLIGFDYNSAISKTICYEWSKYSKIQDCIAPEGSSRENHRQDQAVLTLLLYRYLFNKSFKRYFYPQTNFIYGILFHRKKIYNFN